MTNNSLPESRPKARLFTASFVAVLAGISLLLPIAVTPAHGMTVGLEDLKDEPSSSTKFARGFVTYREVVTTEVVEAKVFDPKTRQRMLEESEGADDFLSKFKFRLRLSKLYLTPRRMSEIGFVGNFDLVGADDIVPDMGGAGLGGFVSKAHANTSDVGEDLPTTVSALGGKDGFFSPVPEPSKMVLALLGTVGILLQRRRR